MLHWHYLATKGSLHSHYYSFLVIDMPIHLQLLLDALQIRLRLLKEIITFYFPRVMSTLESLNSAILSSTLLGAPIKKSSIFLLLVLVLDNTQRKQS